jgi:hypothetical protein
MRLTKHFDVWEWVDFVRGVGDRRIRPAMDEHLSSGCERCKTMVRVLGGFAAMARVPEFEPSEQTLRRAQAIFPVHAPEAGILTRLIYDSFREPLPVGMRSQDVLPRHALYEAGRLFLDLQLDHEPASGLVTLVGQLSDPESTSTSTANVPVLLMAPKGPVASTLSNGAGEFQLEYRPARNLRLHVLLHAMGERLDVGLDRLSPVPPRQGSAARVTRSRRRRVTTKRPKRS